MTTIDAAKTASTPAARAAAAAARAERTATRRGAPPSGQAARLSPGKAMFRHAPVTLNGKSLHQLDGYASVTEMKYEMWDMFGPFTEEIASTAFDTTIAAGPDVAFLVNHKGLTMARTTNGTLALDVDPRGLHSLALLNPARTDVADLLTAIDDENVTEMSFAFMILDAEWNDDYTEFRILEVDIDRGDVSAVNYGANPYTSIAARARELMHEIDELPDGAGRAAFARLATRFAAELPTAGAGMDTDGTEAQLGFGAAGMRSLARAQMARDAEDIAAGPDAAERGKTGRSTRLIETLLELP